MCVNVYESAGELWMAVVFAVINLLSQCVFTGTIEAEQLEVFVRTG